jgi:hypothetical protein
VFRTAAVLHLEYGKLRQLAESARPNRGPVTAKRPRTPFVELIAPPAMGGLECVIELEGPRGKLRIQWKGTAAPDLAGLSRTFWERA